MFAYLHPHIFYETPDITATAAQGAPVPGTGAPTGAPQGQPQQGTGLDWGMFPNVPEEHRSLLEPTIREQIQPYITRLEQQHAPFKAFADAGVNAEDAAGLIQMARAFEQDPVDVWLKMGQAIAQQGHLQELDLDALQAIALGQPYEDPQQQTTGPVDYQLPPEVMQMQQRLAQMEQAQQMRERQELERRQNAAYEQSVQYIRDQVKAAGYPEEALSDETIRAAVVVANGNRDGAVKHLVDLRSSLMQTYVQQNTQPTGNKPRLPNGTPPSRPEKQKIGGSPPDSFTAARGGAEQFLKRQNAANAQG